MKGAIPQSINASAPLTLNNLTINNSGAAVSLNQNVTVTNTTTFTAGKLAIGNNTLTLSGNVINTGSNGITGSTGSNLVITGTVSPALSFDQSVPGVSNALNNFTVNSIGQIPALASDLEVNGAINFTAGKLAINGNTLTLKGTVVNTATGSLRGSSTSNLIISGGISSPVLSFDQTTPGSTNILNNFSINSTGQQITLGNPLITGGSLNLTDGLLTTTALNSLTLAATAGITGGSDLSFVNGPISRNTNSTANFVFPVGKQDIYRPVTVTPATSASGIYVAEYFPATPPAGSHPLLTGIATNEYWDVSKTSGPDAQLTLLYTGNNTWSNGSPTSMDNILVAQNNSGNWEPENGSTIPGNTSSGVTPVTSKLITSFSTFTFGYNLNIVLPVKLLSFKAARINDAIQLLWTTANEVSFAKYELERSADGRSFYRIASIPAAINASIIKSYSWIDHAPLAGTNFYRLKMIDIDGIYKYSTILSLSNKTQKSISVYPNPVTGNTIHLQLIGQLAGDYMINLYNVNSEKVMSTRTMHNGTDAVLTFGLNTNMANGIYYMEISSPEQIKTILKILVKK